MSLDADSLDPLLKMVRREPPNAESPLATQHGVITPNRLFYVRTNFPVPHIDAGDWRLKIDGELERPLELTYEQLRALPSRSLVVTMECAGNGRAHMSREAEGEQWSYGAVSTAEWTGVPLVALLDAVGLTDRAQDIVIQGADGGAVKERDTPVTFERSLTPEQARHPDVILAWAMNGELLPTEHGFPVRLIVPSWYGMAAVKWVTGIRAIPERFDGLYQTYKYVMRYPEELGLPSEPLTAMRPRSLILEPAEGGNVPGGMCVVRGVAWCGSDRLAGVEVSVDDGATWETAEFTSADERYAWRRWEYYWRAESPGTRTLRSRAVTAGGEVQPEVAEWNRLGYGNNAIQVREVTVG